MAKQETAAPLRALQAFSAVVRAGSVVAASDELTVTASAVSHLLRQLEMRLGTRLFTRQGRGLVLTQEGERLAAAVAPALAIQAAIARMGVVVVDPRFIEAELATGQLIVPHPLRVPLADAYWLVRRPGRESVRPVAAFRQWLMTELAVAPRSHLK